MAFVLGTNYVTKTDVGYPKGTRIEFIGGENDDCFTDGRTVQYYSPEEVKRDSNQEPIECYGSIQLAKSKAMSGYDPD